MTADHYPCPCCGYQVFPEPPGSYDICPICFWEDDVVQLAFPRMAGGANTLSLCDSQANFGRIHVSDERFSSKVRAPTPSDKRDPGWRPFDLSKDPALSWESSSDGEYWKKQNDRHCLYWWRPDYWLLRETVGWKFFHAGPEGQNCQIGGISIWGHKWVEISGEMVIAKDPLYGQTFRFPVYQIVHGPERAVFAAGEFSNGMWGFFVPI
jgi:Cysteine-rich CPCC